MEEIPREHNECDELNDKTEEIDYVRYQFNEMETIPEEQDNEVNEYNELDVKSDKTILPQESKSNESDHNVSNITESQISSLQSITSNNINESLQRKIQAKRKILEFRRSELSLLKQELFADGSIMTIQREGKEIIESMGDKLHSRLRNLYEMDRTIKETELELKRIEEIKQQLEKDLLTDRNTFQERIDDLIRLEQLLKRLNADILAKIKELNNLLNDLEAERLRILNDPNLSEEERQRLLAEIDAKINEIKEKYLKTLEYLKGMRADTESTLALKRALFDELKKNGLLDGFLISSQMQLAGDSDRAKGLIEVEFFEGEEEEEFGEEDIPIKEMSSTERLRKEHCDYIKQVLGQSLKQALAFVVLARPKDPITFLGNYLIDYHYKQMKNCRLKADRQDLMILQTDYLNRKERQKPCDPCEVISVLENKRKCKNESKIKNNLFK